MAFEYRIDADRRVVVARPQTAPSLEDWIDVLDRLGADPHMLPEFGIVSDRRHVTSAPDLTYVRGSIQALADRRAFSETRRIAIVTSHLASFGMARMAEVYAEARGLHFRVFMDLDEAIAWAGTTEAEQ
jgi:hypothetical protein